MTEKVSTANVKTKDITAPKIAYSFPDDGNGLSVVIHASNPEEAKELFNKKFRKKTAK